MKCKSTGHECPHSMRISAIFRGVEETSSACHYMLHTDKKRGCPAEECEHYKDEYIPDNRLYL